MAPIIDNGLTAEQRTELHATGNHVLTPHQATRALWYVVDEDRFMSGWGQAVGLTNLVVLPCNGKDEADQVAATVRARPEMEQVRIVTRDVLQAELRATDTDPEGTSGVLWSLLDRRTAPRWYPKPEYRDRWQYDRQYRELCVCDTCGHQVGPVSSGWAHEYGSADQAANAIADGTHAGHTATVQGHAQ